MPRNDDPMRPWNNPMYEDDPFAPHNDPMEKDNPFKPWNNPLGHEDQLSDRERRAYGLSPKRRYDEDEDY